jgi:hypothetical protein
MLPNENATIAPGLALAGSPVPESGAFVASEAGATVL